MNGFFEGQECSSYFIQKNVNGQFEKTIPLIESFIRNDKNNICHIKEAFWTNDTILFLKEILVFEANDEVKPKYYKVSISKAEPKPTRQIIRQSKNISDFIPEGYVLYREEGMPEIKGDLNKDGLEDIVFIIKEQIRIISSNMNIEANWTETEEELLFCSTKETITNWHLKTIIVFRLKTKREAFTMPRNFLLKSKMEIC